MDDQPQEEQRLLDRYREMIQELPEGGWIGANQAPEVRPLEAVEAEIESVLEDIKSYLEAVEEWARTLGFHAALTQAVEAKEENWSALAEWAKGEQSASDERAIAAQGRVEKSEDRTAIRRLRFLLALRDQVGEAPEYVL